MKKLLTGFCAALVAVGSSNPLAIGQQSSLSKSKFPVSLVKKLQAEREKKNLLVSPYSISSALAMTYNGAGGNTKSEMADVLGFGKALDREVNSEYKNTVKKLTNFQNDTKLEVANALFGRKGVNFKKPFLESNREFYGAGLETMDFASPEAPVIINTWVKDKTHEKIDKIVDKVSAETILFLINAVYFKGVWAHEFKKSDTRDEDFKLLNGQKRKVRMMHLNRKDLSYFEDDQLQAIKLFYKDKRLSLSIFLPSEKSSLAAFESKLTEENWSKWKTQFSKREGHLALPKYRVTDKLRLNKTLSAMGMPLAFSPRRADFKAMAASSENIYIGSVLHKTFMEVNEEGTEAAAVTAVVMETTTARMPGPGGPFNMVVNRPFFFVLHDSKTDTILFMGHVVDPKA